MQRSEYKEFFAISQSVIKAFRKKPLQKFKQIFIDREEDDEDDSKFTFGSLCDTLAFQPELLEERFFISNSEAQIPGEKVKLIVDKVFKEASSIVENRIRLNEQGNLPERLYIPNIKDISEFQDLILKYAKEIKYGGTTWSNSRIIESVVGDGYNYFHLLGSANGRSIITTKDNADAMEVVKALQSDKDTSIYFVQKDGDILLFQQEIFSEITIDGNPVPLKGALDIIHISKKNKTARVIDLKSTYDVDNFKYHIKTYDYLTQVSFYMFLLLEFLKTYDNGSCKDYEILPPLNIAITREYKIPYVYEYDMEDLDIVRDGSEEHSVIGWMDTVKEIAWHLHSGNWSKAKEHIDFGKIKVKFYKK